MSLLESVLLWTLLALGVGLGAAVAAAVGYCYGRLARGWSDESAARGTNVIVFVGAVIVGVAVWAVADAGVPGDSALVFDGAAGEIVATIAGVFVGPVVGGVAAAGVGTAAAAGIVRGRPDLPGVGDLATVRRHYARYLTGLLVVIFCLIAAVRPALQGGLFGVIAVAAGLMLVFMICAPLFGLLASSTRRPTDAESARLDDLLEASGLSVRGVRVVEADEQYVATDLSGAPGGRYLFVSAAALETFDDETLTALLVARQEQETHFEAAASTVALVAPLFVFLAVVYGTISTGTGLLATVAVATIGFAGTKRLRYYTDARAAAEVGPDALADAYERACEVAGFDLEDDAGRNWLSTKPALEARIERLREAADASRRSR